MRAGAGFAGAAAAGAAATEGAAAFFAGARLAGARFAAGAPVVPSGPLSVALFEAAALARGAFAAAGVFEDFGVAAVTRGTLPKKKETASRRVPSSQVAPPAAPTVFCQPLRAAR
jgi:hypothetical protein